ncbi:hypothetical protein BDY21DRAFT_389166 [Lineolata rhizophorae]|uniref:CNH domain-containing protein n=1 Tax=Lineolata rhizophorae TaxID=578093 RepID=A0A6A6PDX1_9PEZI|nr:hypothetical protein BDY21DRAFT_389166 [Lineolata rhizophorae]
MELSPGPLQAVSHSAAYLVRNLVDDVPLSADGQATGVRITCVEFWNSNLYIGTSAAEILHFVLIPPDSSDGNNALPNFILASRLQPTSSTSSSANSSPPGVQQILLLPSVNRACILCNNTLTFYSLPELSPAFASQKPISCVWVGGVDQNALDALLAGDDAPSSPSSAGDGVVIMMCLRRFIRLVRIGEEPRKVRDLEFGGCLAAARRDTFACVADSRAYALLDVVQQQKIPLFGISSLDEEAAAPAAGGLSQDISGGTHGVSRSASSASATAGGISRGATPAPAERGGHSGYGHGRSSSLGIFSSGRESSPAPQPQRPASQNRYGFDVPESFSRIQSPRPSTSQERRPGGAEQHSPATGTSRAATPRAGSPDKPTHQHQQSADAAASAGDQTAASSQQQQQLQQQDKPPLPPPKPFTPLKPHIVSPHPSEFLLTTGTARDEPGMGLFVNLEGDLVPRGTLEFGSYPDAIVADGEGMLPDPSASTPSLGASGGLQPGASGEEGYVIAAMQRKCAGDGVEGRWKNGVEIHRWDVGPADEGAGKEWLDLSGLGAGQAPEAAEGDEAGRPPPLGIRTVVARNEITVPEIGEKLSLKRLRLGGTSDTTPKGEAEKRREKEEADFTSRLCKFQSRIVLWAGPAVYCLVRNPLVLRLDAQLLAAESSATAASGDAPRAIAPDRALVEQLLADIRDREPPHTEAEFLGLSYVRQKASVLLFADLLIRTAAGTVVSDRDREATEQALVTGEVDPRVIIALLPALREEVVEGSAGIWIQGGLRELLERFLRQGDVVEKLVFDTGDDDRSTPFYRNIVPLVRRYLTLWRRKKGNPSIPDGPAVFASVDASLLRLLLRLDARSPRGPAVAGSVRQELNAVVDGGVGVDSASREDDAACFARCVTLLERSRRLYVLSRLYQSRKSAANVLETWRRILDGEPDEGGEFTDGGDMELRKYLGKIRDRATVAEYGAWLARRNPALGVQVFADDGSRVKWAPEEAVEVLKEKAPGAVKELLEYLVFGKKMSRYADDLVGYYLDVVVGELERSNEAKTTLLQTYETYRALRPPKPTYRQFIADNAISAEWWHARLRLLQLLGSTPSITFDVATLLARLQPHEAALVPEMIVLNARRDRHDEALRLLTHGLADFDTAIAYCLHGGRAGGAFRVPGGSIPSAPSSSAGAGAGAADAGADDELPTREEQSGLFAALLREFLALEDLGDRLAQTGQLLERFGAWFDVGEVLALVPPEWSVDVVAGFLLSALRRLVRERSESAVVKELCKAANLRASAAVVEKVERLGPAVEREG